MDYRDKYTETSRSSYIQFMLEDYKMFREFEYDLFGVSDLVIDIGVYNRDGRNLLLATFYQHEYIIHYDDVDMFIQASNLRGKPEEFRKLGYTRDVDMEVFEANVNITRRWYMIRKCIRSMDDDYRVRVK